MKRRPAIIALLLVALVSAGWHNQRQLASLRHARASLLVQAAEKGFSGEGESPGSLSLPAKLPRPDRVAEAKQVSAGLIAFANEMKGLPYISDPDLLDGPTRKRVVAEMEGVAGLDAKQLKILIAEIQAASDGSKEYGNLIGFALHRLMKDHPVDALEVMIEPPGLLEMVQQDIMQAEGLFSSAITGLSAQDPTAALEWLRKNRDSLPPYAEDSAAKIMVRATAPKDIHLALTMIREFGLDAASLLPSILPRSTPEERSASLELLRGWGPLKTVSPTSEDPFNVTLKSLAFGPEYGSDNARASFEDSTTWIDQARLSPEELEIVANNLQNNIRAEDAGYWLEWLERKLPPESALHWSGSVFRRLVEADPEAAERWLDAAPASPVKESAVMEYVRRVVSVDPEKAIQRALTLPEGKRRKEALWEIHHDWPQKNEDEAAKAAAEAFAAKHGVRK